MKKELANGKYLLEVINNKNLLHSKETKSKER